jgi:hypothetical protein
MNCEIIDYIFLELRGERKEFEKWGRRGDAFRRGRCGNVGKECLYVAP